MYCTYQIGTYQESACDCWACGPIDVGERCTDLERLPGPWGSKLDFGSRRRLPPCPLALWLSLSIRPWAVRDRKDGPPRPLSARNESDSVAIFHTRRIWQILQNGHPRRSDERPCTNYLFHQILCPGLVGLSDLHAYRLVLVIAQAFQGLAALLDYSIQSAGLVLGRNPVQ